MTGESSPVQPNAVETVSYRSPSHPDILKALAFVAQSVLHEASSNSGWNSGSSAGWNAGIEAALGRILELFHARGLYLHEFLDDVLNRMATKLRHCVPLGQFASTGPLPMRWVEEVSAQHAFTSTIAELPEAEQGFLAHAAALSVSVAPVPVAGKAWGCLVLLSLNPNGTVESELETLSLCAEMLGAAIHHHEAAEQLRIAREHYEFVVNTSPAVSFTREPGENGATTWISENIVNLTGEPASRYIADPEFWRTLVHPDDQAVLTANRPWGQEGKPHVLRLRMRQPDGGYRWIRLDLKPLVRESGPPAGVIGCMVDATESVLLLEDLKQRDAVLSAVGFAARSFLYDECTLSAIPVVLERLGIAAAADRVSLLQVSRDEKGKPLVEAMSEWSNTTFQERSMSVGYLVRPGAGPVAGMPRWRALLARGEIVAGLSGTLPEDERQIVEPCGVRSLAILPVFVKTFHWGNLCFYSCSDRQWSEASLKAMQIAAGMIGAAIRRSETDEKLESRVLERTLELAEANRALRESESLYRTLIEISPYAVILSDLDDRIILANPSCLELFRWPSLDHQAQKFTRECFRPEDLPVADECQRRLLDKGILQCLELTLRRTDGSEFEAEIWVSLVRGADGAPRQIVRIVHDLTQHKHLESQLLQAQKMDAVGRLASGIAHDFNNILTVIKGFGELLARRLKGHPIPLNMAHQIVDASNRAAGLVDQLLAFSRKQMVEPKVVDVNQAIRSAEALLRPLIREDIEFLTALEADAGSVWVDPGQFDQLVMNLVVNARDAMPKGGTLTISTRAFVLSELEDAPFAAMVPGRYALIEVRDTGEGMSDAVRAHIYEPFFTTKEVGKGTGLGLSTVYGIVQQSGGHIAVGTAPGAGCAFQIYIPHASPDPRSLATIPAGQLPHAAGMETILVSEDEASVRSLMITALRECGYTVLESRNGQQALEIAETYTGRIDLLLTDVVMPQMGGLELRGHLVQRFPRMRVLFTSGYTTKDVKLLGSFLKKPFSPDALTAKVRETLDEATS